MSHSIRSEVQIDASPAHVWKVLTDFQGHAGWNPFLVRIQGAPVVGERLTVRFNNGMTMRPTITEASSNRALEWLGSLGFRGLFDGRHRFELIADGQGTRLVHSESFSGVLVPLFKGMLQKTELEFEKLNRALKARVESGV